MKTKILLSLVLALNFCLLHSQVPQGFNYQAIARDGSGNPIVSTPLLVKLTIKPDSSGTGIIWEEIHSSVTTNAYGLFTVVLGKGTRQTGSTVTNFRDIDWSVTPKFLRTDIYYNSAWKFMGTTRLYSVPFAMIANDLGGTLDKLKVRDNGTNPMDSALFEVRNKNGQIVFAVYNEGVRIYVDDGLAKGATKGGFAIGGFGTAKGTSQPLFVVDPDSIRAYIDNNPVKAVKGGFAIGGFDRSKGANQQFLTVSDDSIRMYINDVGKSTKGGFAIGGFDKSKGSSTQYLRVTDDSTRIITSDTVAGFRISSISGTKSNSYLKLNQFNYFIGHLAGEKVILTGWPVGMFNCTFGYYSGKELTTGNNNSFMGYMSGSSTTTGVYNTAIGAYSLGQNTTGNENTAIGLSALWSSVNGSGNTAVGSGALLYNTTGNYNTATGSSALYRNTSGERNTALGTGSLYSNTIGNRNTAIGEAAMSQNTSGGNNTAIGYGALYSNISGSSNTAVGYSVLSSNTTGYDNIAIGDNAMVNNSTGYLNIAIGLMALNNNTSGYQNVGIGEYALQYITSGFGNTASGMSALKANTTGYYNTANGVYTMPYNTSGYRNTATGFWALGQCVTGHSNTAIGNFALYSYNSYNGNYNTAVGDSADLSAANLTNATAIGYYALVNANNKVRIGNSSVTVIEGQVNWSVGSDKRLKDNIVYTNKLGLQFINDLKTVTFTYKNDSTRMHHDGLIAQDVKQTLEKFGLDFSGLTENENQEKILNLSYAEFVVPLINAVKEQQQIIEKQQAEIDHLKSLENEVSELKSLVNTLVANQTGQGNK